MHPKDAIEVFAKGFARSRSLTYGCMAERHSDLWVIHDEPRRPEERVTEIVGWCKPPQDFVEVGNKVGGPRYACCVITDDLTAKKPPAGFKEEGFRRFRREPFFVRDLTSQRISPDPHILRVTTPEQAELVRLACQGHRQLRPEDLDQDDGEIRTYYAVNESQNVIGRVNSLRINDAA